MGQEKDQHLIGTEEIACCVDDAEAVRIAVVGQPQMGVILPDQPDQVPKLGLGRFRAEPSKEGIPVGVDQIHHTTRLFKEPGQELPACPCTWDQRPPSGPPGDAVKIDDGPDRIHILSPSSTQVSKSSPLANGLRLTSSWVRRAKLASMDRVMESSAGPPQWGMNLIPLYLGRIVACSEHDPALTAPLQDGVGQDGSGDIPLTISTGMPLPMRTSAA